MTAHRDIAAQRLANSVSQEEITIVVARRRELKFAGLRIDLSAIADTLHADLAAPANDVRRIEPVLRNGAVGTVDCCRADRKIINRDGRDRQRRGESREQSAHRQELCPSCHRGTIPIETKIG